MTINIRLSTESIARAISRLQQAKQNLQDGLSETIEILTSEGAEIAQAADGSMATVTGYMDGETTGIIEASGGDEAIIAEFGAGDATIPVMFENYPGVDVYPGAYSEQVGSGEYAMTGRWHFGGQMYTEVEPRAGLLNAKYYIQEVAGEVAQEVIML